MTNTGLEQIHCWIREPQRFAGWRPMMRRLLQEVRDQPRSVEAVWHPLGFIYARLSTEGTSITRLHIWPACMSGGFDASTNVHDHSWNLTSRVICGYLVNHLYEIQCSCESATHRVYEVDYDGTTSYLRPTTKVVRCEHICSVQICEGDRYTIEQRSFHNTQIPAGVLVATLVIAETNTSMRPRVLGSGLITSSTR